MRYATDNSYNKNMSIWISVVFLSLLMISVVSPGVLAVLNAQQTSTPTPRSSMPCNNTYVKALVLYNILNTSLSLNLSKETVDEIKNLLSMNISVMSCDKLSEWVKNASKTLSSIENMVKEGRAYAVGLSEERYLEGLKKALENRLRVLGQEYNISVNDIIANISSAKNIKEIIRELGRAEHVLAVINTRKFVDVLVRVGVEDSVKSVKDLEKSLKDLEIASRLINETVERLSKYNLSEDIMALLKEALLKISAAKSFLENISRTVSTEGEGRLKEVFNKSSLKYYEEILEELEELRQELIDMKQHLLSINETNATLLIDELLSKINNLYNQIKNISIEDLSRWIPDLLEIKARAQYLREMFKKIIEISLVKYKVPGATAYEILRRQVYELISEITNMSNYINTTYHQICMNVSTDLSTTLHQCQLLKQVIPELLNYTNKSIEIAKNLVAESEELYKANKTIEAIMRLSQAKAVLELTKAKLTPVYELLKKLSEEKRESEKTKTTTPRIKVFVEGKIKILRNTTKLELKIKNEGDVDIVVNKIIIAITPAISIDLNISVKPGDELTVEKDLMLTLIQLNTLRNRDSVPAIFIVNNEITVMINLEIAK